MEQQNISIVISLFNEEEGVIHFWNSLQKILSPIKEKNFELLWVNDGSTDGTQKFINHIREENSSSNIKNISIEFSRNFGHESAMIAGIDNASGDAIICIDSDGQHPPEEIPKMIAAYNDGNDIVLMQRSQSVYKRIYTIIRFFQK